MGGRAALIFVMGFGVALGMLSIRLNWIGSSTVSNYVTYGSYTISHDLASAGINVGLSMLYQNPALMR